MYLDRVAYFEESHAWLHVESYSCCRRMKSFSIAQLTLPLGKYRHVNVKD